MQDHFGAKSANWMAIGIVNLDSNFMNLRQAEPCNKVETFSERWRKLLIVGLVAPCWARCIVREMLSQVGIGHFENRGSLDFSHFQDRNKVWHHLLLGDVFSKLRSGQIHNE